MEVTQQVLIDQKEVDNSTSFVTLYSNAVEPEVLLQEIEATPNEEWIECHQPIPKTNVEVKVLRRVLWGAPEGQELSILTKKRPPVKNLHPSLVALQKSLAETYRVHLDAYLVQEFQNGGQYVGFRSDSDATLGTEFSTVMVTLGTSRKVVFKELSDGQREKDCLRRGITFVPSATKRKLKQVEFTLNAGSVLVISGSTQRFWSHSIPPDDTVTAKTVVVTFRPHDPTLKFKRVMKPKQPKVKEPKVKKAKSFDDDEDDEVAPKKRKRAPKKASSTTDKPKKSAKNPDQPKKKRTKKPTTEPFVCGTDHE